MHDLAIVGAGPAGMAAALAVADAGFSVTVVDEQARAGGQIFRRPPEAWGVRHGRYAPYSWAKGLIERFEEHPRIETCFRSTAFGVMRDRSEAQQATGADGQVQLSLAVSTPEGGRLLPARRLLLATGAYDMPVAFPGWTLPGVMTSGSVQSFLKSQKLLVGQRLVLAGSHPIMLVLAEQLIEAGADIAEIAFARGLPGPVEMARGLPAVPGHVALFSQAAAAVRKIVAAGVKISTRTIVVEARGEDALSEVRLAKVDRNWKPVGEPRAVRADVLALGYGFSPSTELARQAGCDLHWNSALGGWVVAHDAQFATTADGIFVAGEPTGIAGAERSWAEGQVAGLSIAESLGASSAALRQQRAEVEHLLMRAGRFSRLVQRMFEPRREALATLSGAPDTIICRCELVRSAQVDEALTDNPFILSANAVKLQCRSGMGPCQGRYCEGTVAARIALARGADIASSGHFNAHLPVKPVPLQAYCCLGSDHGS